MDDSGFKNTRLSLIIISIGIIIFILGEGTIDKTNIFFGSIDLKDDAPVKWAAVLIYMYLLWRYWMYKYKIMGDFGEEFKRYFYRSDDYAYLALKIVDACKSDNKQDYILAIKSYHEHGLPHKRNIIRGKDQNKVERCFYPLMLSSLLYPKRLHTSFIDSDNPDANEYELPKYYFLEDEDELFEISTLQFICLELMALPKMIFTRWGFADFLLPVAIALWAGYLLLATLK